MSPDVHLSVIVPCYNEGKRIEASLRTLQKELERWPHAFEVHVVDDGSRDDSLAIARAMAERDARFRVHAEPHRGKGASVRTGMLAARGRYRFMCDADLAMPLRELPRFVEAVGGEFDIAIATRESAQAVRVGEPPYRRVLGRVFNSVVRSLVRQPFRDTQCGFKLFTAEAAETVFRLQTLEGWAFDVELLEIAAFRGLGVVEVPIEWHFAESETIRPLRDGLAMTRDVLRIRRNVRSGRYRSAR
ncbi:MAG: glycosyltransferase family 2 protein [Myxococcota bacterium]|nr:glycosyltransferase family 2 protein [Myxococcota bacterium]